MSVDSDYLKNTQNSFKLFHNAKKQSGGKGRGYGVSMSSLNEDATAGMGYSNPSGRYYSQCGGNGYGFNEEAAANSAAFRGSYPVLSTYGKPKQCGGRRKRRSRSSRKKRGRGTPSEPKTCSTGESWDYIAKKCSPIDVALHVDPVGPNDNRIRTWSASSGVGGKRRKRRRTKRRKSKGRRGRSRRKSRKSRKSQKGGCGMKRKQRRSKKRGGKRKRRRTKRRTGTLNTLANPRGMYGGSSFSYGASFPSSKPWALGPVGIKANKPSCFDNYSHGKN